VGVNADVAVGRLNTCPPNVEISTQAADEPVWPAEPSTTLVRVVLALYVEPFRVTLAVITALLPDMPLYATVAVLSPLSVIVAPAAVNEAVPIMLRRWAVTVM
jgi:hypothetical protein